MSELSVAETPLVVSLLPEYGSPWGLWSSSPPFPYRDPTTVEQLGPDNFGFGDDIREALRNWLDAWHANFADSPYEHPHTWKYGFDIASWISEGARISRMIEESLPGYRVERGYQSYANSPVRAGDR